MKVVDKDSCNALPHQLKIISLWLWILQLTNKSRMMVRNQRITDVLYQDAISRIKRKEIMSKERNTSYRSNSEWKSSERVNSQMIASRLIKEFEKACSKHWIKPNKYNIDFAQLVLVLTSMEYVGKELNDDEKNLINFMWSTLRGDELGGVSARNIIFFLFGIHLLKIDEIIHPSNRSKAELHWSSDISGLINKIEYENDADNQFKAQPSNKSLHISQLNILEDEKLDESQIGAYWFSENKFFYQSFEEQIKMNKLFKQFLTKKATKAKCAYFIGKDASPIDPRFTYRPEINTKSSELADHIYK